MKQVSSPGRVQSIDVMRGMIMIFLAAESCLLYVALREAFPGNIIVNQFVHHRWHGLTFWDLVQPAFMFIAGTSLYISWTRRRDNGITWSKNFKNVAWRSFKLLFFGVALHCVSSGKLVWELWNVLVQLAATLLIAYLVIRWSFKKQILFSIFLLILTEVLYRTISIPGFDQPFIKGENFGTYMDLLLMGKTSSGGWVTVNFLPTAAHTVWGVLVGRLVISSTPALMKLKYIALAGVICLILGYALDLSNITPIIKRISTSSFVLVSGGYILLIFAFTSWLTDVKGFTKYAWIPIVVGMNPIFIYLFFETIGKQWLNGVSAIFVGQSIASVGIPDNAVLIIVALATLFAEWYLCYWLYKRKIFFKL